MLHLLSPVGAEVLTRKFDEIDQQNTEDDRYLSTSCDCIFLANLLSQGTIVIRDSIKSPFLAVEGENLVIEGKQGIDIFALNHPASQLISEKEIQSL